MTDAEHTAPHDLPARPARDEDHVATAVFDGEAVLYHEPSSEVLHLNATASLVWQLSDGTVTVDELVAELADAYGEEPSRVDDAIRAVLVDFDRHGLLRR